MIPGSGVPDPRASVRFFALSALCFAGLALFLPVAVTRVDAFRHNPILLMAVHLLVLALTALEMGAIYQMAPSLLNEEPANRRQAAMQPLVLAAGIVLLLAGFRWWQATLLATGGTLVLITAVWFAVLVAPSLRRALPRDVTAIYLTGAVLSLLLVVTLGVLLALNLRYGFLPGGAGTHLGAHLALGAGGWFGLAIIGVSYRLSAMFYMVRRDEPLADSRWLAWLTVGSVLAPATALFFGAYTAGRWMLAPAALLGLTYAGLLTRRLLRRQRRLVDMTLVHMFTAAGILVPACAGLLAIAAGWDPPRRLWALLGLLLLPGWVGNMVMGLAHRVLPFLVWYSRFAPLAGKAPIPSLADLLPRRWPGVAYALWNAGLLGLMLALLAGAAPAWQTGAGLLAAAGAIAFAVAAVAVLLRRAQEPVT